MINFDQKYSCSYGIDQIIIHEDVFFTKPKKLPKTQPKQNNCFFGVTYIKPNKVVSDIVM